MGHKHGCCAEVRVLDTLMRAVGSLPVWVYGRRWLLGLLFACLMGVIFMGQRRQKHEFRA